MPAEGTGTLVVEDGCCITLEGTISTGDIRGAGTVLVRAGTWLPLVAMWTGLVEGGTEEEEEEEDDIGGGGVSWMTDVLLCLTGFSCVTGATTTKDSRPVCWDDASGGAGLTSPELFGAKGVLMCGSANTDTPLTGGMVASF